MHVDGLHRSMWCRTAFIAFRRPCWQRLHIWDLKGRRIAPGCRQPYRSVSPGSKPTQQGKYSRMFSIFYDVFNCTSCMARLHWDYNLSAWAYSHMNAVGETHVMYPGMNRLCVHACAWFDYKSCHVPSVVHILPCSEYAQLITHRF